MKKLSPVQILLLSVFLFTGCANYRTVSILIRDDSTKRPIPGVVVTTYYVPEPFSFAYRKQMRATTDQNGIALLRANYLQHEPTLSGKSEFSFDPSYCVDTPGYMWTSLGPSADDVERLLKRKSDEHPSEPDFILDLTAEPDRANKDPNLCTQQGIIRQLDDDFAYVWKYLTSRFRSAKRID